MNKDDEIFLVGLIIIVGLIVSFPIVVSLEAQTRTDNANQFTEDLVGYGVFVDDRAVVDSPSLVLKLDKEEFLQYAKEKGVVYSTGWQFYVFEDTMLIAYRYAVTGMFGW